MKKGLVWLLVVCLFASLCLVGCGGDTPSVATSAAGSEPESVASAGSEGGTADYSDKKVVVLLSGVISDNGWNQIGYESVINLKDKYGVTADYIENIAVSDMEEYIRSYASENYDMIIVHGSQFIDNLLACADDYPDVAFCVSYGDEDVSQGKENVACVGPINMGVMIGAIMGILTENNKVCFLGGQDIPAITNINSGIEDGVRLTNPDAEVINDYIGTLTDADLAYNKAAAIIDQGVDVICASANSAQLGVLKAAQDKGILALGFNGDQYSIAPEAIVLSVMRNYPYIYEDIFLKVVDGSFTGGQYTYNIQQMGTIVSDWHGWDEKLPAEKVDAINETIAKLQAGELGDW